jgi:type II secretory pathway component PulK
MKQPDSRSSTSICRRGASLAMTLVTLVVVMMVAGALVESMLATHRQSKRYQAQAQAQWLAEAGLSRAVAQLARQSDYDGETWQAPVGGAEAEYGAVTIRIEPRTETTPRRIIVEAVYPLTEHQRILVRRELSIP